MTEKTIALINYRLERADETLAEAKLLASGGHWNGVASRLYYACYYALIAVFLKTEGKSPKTHAGVKALFNLNFVKTGLVSTELGRLFARTFQRRQDGDYADMIKFLAEDIEPLLDETEKFINTIKKIIEQ